MISHEGHDGETFAAAKARYWHGLRHPFTRNPAARNRYGWADFLAGHSITNLYVTWAREQPRSAGHLWRYTAIALAAVAVFAAVGWLL